jgi:hypothetical protein
VITVVTTKAGSLGFPGFEEGSRLPKLVRQIAIALSTTPRTLVDHMPLEVLVGFEGYPDEFALWWDGFSCELGLSAACSVEMTVVKDRLLDSGAFELGN